MNPQLNITKLLNTALCIATGYTLDTDIQHMHDKTNIIPLHTNLKNHNQTKPQHPTSLSSNTQTKETNCILQLQYTHLNTQKQVELLLDSWKDYGRWIFGLTAIDHSLLNREVSKKCDWVWYIEILQKLHFDWFKILLVFICITKLTLLKWTYKHSKTTWFDHRRISHNLLLLYTKTTLPHIYLYLLR